MPQQRDFHVKSQSFVRSPAAPNIIALLALVISIWSALYAHRLGKFSESTYVEEKRSAIRLLAYDLEATGKDFLEDVDNFLSKSDYKFKTEDTIRLGKVRDDMESLIESTGRSGKHTQRERWPITTSSSHANYRFGLWLSEFAAGQTPVTAKLIVSPLFALASA